MIPPSIPTDIQVFRARMAVPREELDDLLDAMAIMDEAPGSWENVDTGEAWIEAFGIDEDELYQRAREMADIAESVDGRVHVAQIEPLAREDWTESWKKFFHIIHVTDKITIRPIWEEYDAAEGEIVVDIEPGMSFGTGIHPTTQSCLKLLEQICANKAMLDSKVIDMGCGSGILSIAAKKLGYREVEGYDYDPAAVKVSKENSEHNGLKDKIPFDVADVTAPTPLPRGNVVVANILAVVLIDAAKAIAASVDVSAECGHALILSGILENQYEEVKAAYQAEGFVEKQNIQIGEWKSGLFVKA